MRADGSIALSPPDRSRGRLVAGCVGLFLLVVAVFWPLAGAEFLVCDDPDYVYENPMVLRGLTLEGVRWAFAAAHAANWHPLTWLSHMLDCELFAVPGAGADGQWAGGHHLVNVALHGTATVLLFLALVSMSLRPATSVVIAALFAVHPQHVESVAWVAERKDVLSGCFWMVALIAYARYARRPSVGRYLCVAAALGLGLMAKPMVVTLPFVFLLLDWWPLRRPSGPRGNIDWRRRVTEKLPLFTMVVAVAVMTWISQRAAGSMRSDEGLPLAARAANAMVAVAAYLWRTVWPVDLAIFYPHPFLLSGGQWTMAFVGQAMLASILIGGLTWIVFRERQARPHLLFGWLYYLGTLVPVIGLVQVGSQARADRYTYLPLIGIFLAATMGAGALAERWRLSLRQRRWIASAVVGALAAASMVQVTHWRSNEALFRHAVEVVEQNYLAHNHLGLGYHRAGRIDDAAAQFDRAIEIRGDDSWALNNRAVCWLAKRELDKSEQCLRRALDVDPGFADAWNSLGNVHFFRRNYAEAAACYDRAMRSARSERIEYAFNMALAAEKLRRWDDAARLYTGVLQVAPDNAQAACRMGLVAAAAGRRDAAKAWFDRVMRAHGETPEVLYGQAVIAMLDRDPGRAEERLRAALARGPGLGEAQRALAGLLADRGEHTEAIAHYERALAIDGADPDVQNDLAVACAQTGQRDAAARHLQEAVRNHPEHGLATENLRELLAGGRPQRRSGAR